MDLLRECDDDDQQQFYRPTPFVMPYPTTVDGPQHTRGASADSNNSANSGSGLPLSATAHEGYYIVPEARTHDPITNDPPANGQTPASVIAGTNPRTRLSMRKTHPQPYLAYRSYNTGSDASADASDPTSDPNSDTNDITSPISPRTARSSTVDATENDALEPRIMRVIQHADAGPHDPTAVVELPPAYSVIQHASTGSGPLLPPQRPSPQGPLPQPPSAQGSTQSSLVPSVPPMKRSYSSPAPFMLSKGM